MTDIQKQILRLSASLDQDMAACDQWWTESQAWELDLVWSAIQAMAHGSCPIHALVGKFAQLAFAQAAARCTEKRDAAREG